MTVFRISFAVAVFSGLLTISAVASTTPSAAEYKWDSKSEATFVRMMCADGEYFRECFSSTQRACEQALKAEARSCDAALTPAKRKTFTSEVPLFAEIGLCVGQGIEKKWRDRKASSSKCDHKENWQ